MCLFLLFLLIILMVLRGVHVVLGAVLVKQFVIVGVMRDGVCVLVFVSVARVDVLLCCC